jgi:hypothetical protein
MATRLEKNGFLTSLLKIYVTRWIDIEEPIKALALLGFSNFSS